MRVDLIRKDILVLLLPDPGDLVVCLRDLWHVVLPVAGLGAGGPHLFVQALL
jgi:hypothetical protein